MTATRCALVNSAGLVTNIIMATPGTDAAPAGSALVACPSNAIGDSYANGTFTAAAVTQTAAQATAALAMQLSALDSASARSLRSILLAIHAGTTPNAADLSMLQAHETAAIALRAQIQSS